VTAQGWRGPDQRTNSFTRYDPRGASPLPLTFGEVAELRRPKPVRTFLAGAVWFGVLLAVCWAWWVLS
jgi:hypothetical protein